MKDVKDSEIAQLHLQIYELNEMKNSNISNRELNESFIKIDNWVQTEPIMNYMQVDHATSPLSKHRQREVVNTPFSSVDE